MHGVLTLQLLCRCPMICHAGTYSVINENSGSEYLFFPKYLSLQFYEDFGVGKFICWKKVVDVE